MKNSIYEIVIAIGRVSKGITRERVLKVLLIGVVAVVLSAFFIPLQSYGQTTFYWVGGSGSWGDPNKWSFAPGGPGGAGPPQPKPENDVFLIQSDDINRTVEYANTVYPSSYFGSLMIDSTGSGTMTLSQSKDTLVGMETVIGYDGRGVVNQTGGTYGYLDMILGYNSTGSGTYNLSGGDLVSIQWAPTRIGYSGTGIFNHTGGINDTYNLVIGGKGGTGTYNLGGTGELIGYVSRIGYLSGTGTFNQSGGSHKTCWLEMGPNSTYNLSGTGFLESCSIDSDGTFNYSGGSLHFYDIFGFGNGGNFNLSGRGNRIVGGNLGNGGVIRTTNTSTIFDGTLGNGGAFISDSSVNIFTDLIIGEDGYMQGDWEDLWYVCDKFQGVKIEGNVVTNIFGSEGMYIFYLPAENAYLGGLTYNLTGGGELVPTSKCPELVEIDVKPGTYSNDINLNSKGVVPVAILTTADFDANSVDPRTVVFAGAKKPRWTRADVNNDGRLDLLFHFNTQDLDLTEESTAAILSGTTYDGMDIIGRDTVSVVPAKKKLISIQFSESKGRVIKALPFLLSGSKWRSQ